MVLAALLSQKKAAILERWRQLILDTYPADSARFLKEQPDQFANPVGHVISRDIPALFDGLLQGKDAKQLSVALDSIVRIRSVQDYSPAEAIAFVFLLKRAVREGMATELQDNQASGELRQFESAVDNLALLAFDTYVACREKVHELRVNEVKTEREMLLRLLDRTNPAGGETGAITE